VFRKEQNIRTTDDVETISSCAEDELEKAGARKRKIFDVTAFCQNDAFTPRAGGLSIGLGVRTLFLSEYKQRAYFPSSTLGQHQQKPWQPLFFS
jgi:hypothetical protein